MVTGQNRGSQPRCEFRAWRDNRGVAFRPGGNHADFTPQIVGDEFQIVARGLGQRRRVADSVRGGFPTRQRAIDRLDSGERSEEHTSELQSLAYLVCRLLLEKKKIK